VLLGYFWAPIPWMIEVALILSLVVRHWTDAVIIGVLLVMNGAVAFTEEHQAANAIAALKQRLAASARVLRDGGWRTVPVAELVPGDVIRVRLGMWRRRIRGCWGMPRSRWISPR
jgi:H+-transporting ATPase